MDPPSHSIGTGLRVSICLAVFLALVSGVGYVTIDHDEGFFCEPARSFIKEGRFSTPWSEIFLGHENFIPLNSLVPVLMTVPYALELDPLFLGRIFSSIAVSIGVWFLIPVCRSKDRTMHAFLVVFGTTSLAVWQAGRVIRPESFVFALSCVLVFVRCGAGGGLGAISGISILFHTLYGLVLTACAAVFTLCQASCSGKGDRKIRHLAAFGLVSSGVVFVFYVLFYHRIDFRTLVDQVVLFIRFTPGITEPQGPIDQAYWWLKGIQTQTSQIPVLVVTLASIMVPVYPSRKLLWLKVLMVIFMIVSIFFYEKKSVYPTTALLAPALLILAKADLSSPHRRKRAASLGVLGIAIIANLSLSARYHFRLFTANGKSDQVVQAVMNAIPLELRSQGLKIIGKSWLGFGLGRDDKVYDLTIVVAADRLFDSDEEQKVTLLKEMNVAVIEVGGHRQQQVLDFYRAQGWIETSLVVIRYFSAQELVVIHRPIISKPFSNK